LPLYDEHTGERIATELFVGALGASSYTFAWATFSQDLPTWLDCHVRMYEFFSGVSAITVPDNLKSAIKSPDRYEAEINPAYRELAEHYGTCIIAARVKKPRDKGKVEAAVLVAQRWILAVLRHQRFYHIEDLNRAIGELLTRLNDRVMRHVKQSRRQLYERLDRPALKALPVNPYEYAEWKKVGVNIDYHVNFDDHFYSAPYTLIGETLWCRATVRPEWTPSRLIEWGRSVGVHTAAVIDHVIRSKPHPEQGYRSALGILRLSRSCGAERLELACARALDINSPHYRTIKTMLKQRMEGVKSGEPAAAESNAALGAANVRGPRYYH
jgi:hypothetical protein